MLKWNLRILSVITLTISLSGCSSLLVDLGLEDPESDRGLAAISDRGDCDSPECRAEQNSDNARNSPNRRISVAIQNNDIVVGMSRSEVVESWGEPAVREVAGSGSRGHERWTYGSRFSLDGERYLIFESGQVVGWHR